MPLWSFLTWLDTFIGPIANILQLVVVGLAFYGFIDLWAKRRRYRNLLRVQTNKVKPGTTALSIGIRTDIRANVDAYLAANNLGWIHHEKIYEPGTIPPEQFPDLLLKVYQKRQELASMGCSELHLFFAGPITLGMGIGTMLDNWVPVKVYQWDKAKATYVYDYTLEKGIILALEG